ncbi:tyrosine-protein phosphatase [Nonomuraea sp. NPDC048916]|uniref:tyrosine-protein phosphatase n=1 Tax=Nonomuraea sp. NPDC048916 TaxID=3154232 RepID=UPI0033DB89EB
MPTRYTRPSGRTARRRSTGLVTAAVAGVTMLATLAHLRERYRGAEAYLQDAGLPAEDLALLRARLTTED